MDADQQRHKFSGLCVIVFFGTIICSIFLLFVSWVHKQGKVNQIEWDFATITAGDYTVDMQINEENYKNWYHNEYLKPGGDSSKLIPPSLSLKNHLIRVIEEYITNDLNATTDPTFA
jgi:hypothetical protein